MSREELEKAVYDIVSNDMQVCLFESDDWIRRQIKKATYEDLIEYLEEV